MGPPAWGIPSKMKAPQQMLWAAIVREVVLALDDELPDKLNDHHARSEELAEEPCLRQPRTDAMFCSVLDVLGNGQEVREPVDSIVYDVGLVGAIVVIVCHVCSR